MDFYSMGWLVAVVAIFILASIFFLWLMDSSDEAASRSKASRDLRRFRLEQMFDSAIKLATPMLKSYEINRHEVDFHNEGDEEGHLVFLVAKASTTYGNIQRFGDFRMVSFTETELQGLSLVELTNLIMQSARDVLEEDQLEE